MPAPIIYDKLPGLNEALGNVGSAFGAAIQQGSQQRQQAAKQRKYGSILEETIGSIDENASPLQITQALTQAVNQGLPTEIAQQYGSLYATLQKTKAGMPPGPEQIGTMATLFQKFGMPEEVAQRNAELWANLTTGGQTEMAKLLVDQISRNQFQPVERQVDFQSMTVENQAIPGEAIVSEQEVEEFSFPKVNVFEDRTPKERAQLKGDLLKQNNAEYKDVSEKLRKVDSEIMRYDQLERLNESGKLPKNFGRLNVDWAKGDIRIPFLANEETQLFVKTINDFTVAAKDTFGARVTNFELGAFMKRLPTLANSEEGRRLIIEQMKSMKELDRLYDDSIKKVYDHYGMQKIDRATVEKIAEDLRKDDEEKLKTRFEDSVNAQTNFDLRQRAPEGHLPVKKPDGSIGFLPINKIDAAKRKGWEIL